MLDVEAVESALVRRVSLFKVSGAVVCLVFRPARLEMLVAGIIGEINRIGRECPGEMADAREPGARKFFSPRADKESRVSLGGEREDEFVVFAIGERGPETAAWAERNRGGDESRHGAARRERAKILRETITDIEHRADTGLGGEPRACGETWSESKMVAGAEAPAEDTGYIDTVAGTRAGASDDAVPGGGPEEREAGGDDALGLCDVATDDRHVITAGTRGETAVELLQPRDTGASVESEREHGSRRPAAHGGEVAQVALKKLRPDGTGQNGGVEVATKDHGVDRDELWAG